MNPASAVSVPFKKAPADGKPSAPIAESPRKLTDQGLWSGQTATSLLFKRKVCFP